MRKRFLSVVLVIALILSFPMMGVSAQESGAPLRGVALGDSVPAFYGVDEGDGYVARLSELLYDEGIDIAFTNLAVSGLTTQTLLALLEDGDVLAALRDADVITLNIGGNNILIPFINVIMQQLAALGITDFSAIPPQQLMELAAMKLTDEQMAPLMAGVAAFEQDFPAIISTLYMTAPNAKIYVNTVYNPIPALLGVHEAAELLITSINKIIADAADYYAVVDIYAAFAASAGVITNFDMMSGSVDIHPNADGHTLIAMEIAAVMLNKEGAQPHYLTRSEALSEIISLVTPYITTMDDADPGLLEPFGDVGPEHKDFEAVMKAKAYGIVVGVGGGSFNPDGMMTRQDFALLSVKIFGMIKGDEAIAGLGDVTQAMALSDFALVADYAKQGVAIALALGIIVPADGEIDYLGGITSGDVTAAMLKLAQFGF